VASDTEAPVKWAEVVYEDKSHSIVAIYDKPDDNMDTFKAGLAEQHRRAIEGEPGAPQDLVNRTVLDPDDQLYVDPATLPENFANAARVASRPASRVRKVYMYDKHPADHVVVGNDGNAPVSAAAVQELVSGMAGEGNTVNMHQLTQALRDEASPMYPNEQGAFESHFKMPETEELDLAFLDSAGTGGAS